jgi:hypothetical protein
MEGFVLSHTTYSYINIIKDGYLRIPNENEEGAFGKSEQIFFELMSIHMPKTAPGISLYYSPKLLEKYDATFQVSWGGIKDKEIKINKNNIKNDLIKFQKLSTNRRLSDIKKNKLGFGNQIIIYNTNKISNKYLIGVQNPIYMYIDPYGHISYNPEFALNLHKKEHLKKINEKEKRKIKYYLKKYNYKNIKLVKNITELV